MLSNSLRAWPRTVWLDVGLWLGAFGRLCYPSASANRPWGAVPAECRGAVLFLCLGVVTRGAPPGEQEPCRYIMTTSWLAGIKPLCLAVWLAPWKVQHHVFGDSHNETFLCLLWSELMAFPLLEASEQARLWSNWGVFATLPTVLPV